MKKIVLVLTMVITIIGAGVLGVTTVSAQNTNPNTQDTLVQKVADTFRLDKTDVQKVFDEHHTEQKVQMEKKLDERLNQLVKDGKITEAQKQAILAKLKELHARKQANKDTLTDMTKKPRKEAMQKEKADLEAWAKEQGVDLKMLFGGFDIGMRMHMK